MERKYEMSSKRNHAIRSHKTYRARQYAAARNLRGSLPYNIRKKLYEMRFGIKNEQEETSEEPEAAAEEVVA